MLEGCCPEPRQPEANQKFLKLFGQPCPEAEFKEEEEKKVSCPKGLLTNWPKSVSIRSKTLG